MGEKTGSALVCFSKVKPNYIGPKASMDRAVSFGRPLLALKCHTLHNTNISQHLLLVADQDCCTLKCFALAFVAVQNATGRGWQDDRRWDDSKGRESAKGSGRVSAIGSRRQAPDTVRARSLEERQSKSMVV
eukprot:5056412-Amphidinium_carterae.1